MSNAMQRLCQELRNIARGAEMMKGTRTRLHAIAHEIETEAAEPTAAPLASNPKTHPTPWRIERLNVPLADTGDHDGLTKILAADGDEVAHWWNADDIEEALAEHIVQTVNAVETRADPVPNQNGWHFWTTTDRGYRFLNMMGPNLQAASFTVPLDSVRAGVVEQFEADMRAAVKTTAAPAAEDLPCPKL